MQLEGHIGEIDVVERLVELWRERFTGAFRFEQDGVIKIIYFKSGDVLSASTNDRTDAIDEILLRAGKVNREHIKQALAKRKESETLGDALLNLGFITRKELTWARRVQVIGILRSIRGWAEGTYTGVADYLPKREEGTLFPLPQVILELILTDSERPHFEQAMDGGAAVFAKTAEFDETYAKLGLNEEADDIVGQVDGGRSASEIAAAAGADAFNAFKLLEALRVLGMIEKAASPAGGLSLDDFAAVGVSDANEAWSAPGGQELDFDTPPPTLEIPAAEASEPEWSMPEPQWQSEAETPSFADVPLAAPMEATEKIAPYEPPTPQFKPAPIVPPTIAPEPQWGFDEAQIETARRAAVPLRSRDEVPLPPSKEVIAKASKPGRVGVAVLIGVALVAVGFGGYAAWWWWQQRNQPAPAVLVKRPAKKPLQVATTTAVAPVPTSTATTPTATTSTMIATAAPISTATTASAAPPLAKPLLKPATAPPPALSTAGTHLERTAAGAATITNTTASARPATAPAGTDPLRAKYDSMAKEQLANREGAYTIQFELVCETASVTRALRDGGSTVWFVPSSYKGRDCYRVFWGRYATAAEAQRAIVQIPPALREAKAAVVKIPR